MEVIKFEEDFPQLIKTCVTVGTFDGLHLGHGQILSILKQTAEKENLKSVVVTFRPHPRQVLFPKTKVNFVLSEKEKLLKFSQTGIDFLVIMPFSLEFASLTAKEFLTDILVKKLGMKHLIKGFNNHFGKDRLSDIDKIKEIGFQYGFSASQVGNLVLEGGVSASSTLVRKLLTEGSVDEASKILGYDFFFTGKVVHGKHIGTSIGFPTANILIEDENKIIPKSGVYASLTTINSVVYPVMLNIGHNPTVNGNLEKTFLEAHIIGFDSDIYGQEISLVLKQRIRDEIKFPSLEDLKKRLNDDKQTVIQIVMS